MIRAIERQAPARGEGTPSRARAPHWLRRNAISLAAFALALGAGASGSNAAMAPDELDVADATLMTGAELDGSRGGFALGPFFLNLGIQITTTVNNAVTVQTVLSLNPATLAANITSGVTTAANAAANAGANAAAIAASAGATAAAAASNAASATILGTTLPQVVVASVAGEPNLVQQGGTGGATDAIPIPVAGAVIGEIQDSVEQSGIGDYLPSQTTPAPTTSGPIETPQQLADLVLSALPSAQDVEAYGAAQGAAAQAATADSANGLTTGSQLADQIVNVLSAAEADQAVGTGAAPAAQTVDPAVTISQLTNGAVYDIDGTTITHQIMNGILASIQNSANNVDIQQTVQMTVDIQNFDSTIGSAATNMQAAGLADEVARFSSTLGN